MIKLLIILAFCLLFWLGCYKNTGTDEKNLLGFRSYPDEIQNMIYRNENLSKKVPAGMVEKHLKNPFSFIPEKEMYQNPKKHVDSFLRGIPSFALSALLAACILCILP